MRYDEYFVTVHGNAFIDFVGKRRAYAVRCKDDCYKIQISKDRPDRKSTRLNSSH